MSGESTTQEKILEAGQKEFLEKGFLEASLRKIVRDAGVTTGAFYRYYPTKEALFEALAKPPADALTGYLEEGIKAVMTLPVDDQTRTMLQTSGDYMDRIVDYVYAHYDSCKLLLCCAGGTVYEDFVHRMVEKEVEATYQYMDALRASGHPVPELDPGLCHMISSGMFSGMFEMGMHDMEKEEARERIAWLKEFHTGGWERILKVKFDS